MECCASMHCGRRGPGGRSIRGGSPTDKKRLNSGKQETRFSLWILKVQNANMKRIRRNLLHSSSVNLHWGEALSRERHGEKS